MHGRYIKLFSGNFFAVPKFNLLLFSLKQKFSMKHYLHWLVSLFIATLVFAGCQHRADPKDVSLKFLTAIQRADYTEAKKYATEDSKAMLDALSSFQKMLPEASREKIKNEKFVIKDVAVNDSIAIVTYASNTDTMGKTLKLKMEQGQWKVAFTKETILPELNKPLNEGDSTMIMPDSSLMESDSSLMVPDSSNF